jgi:hypothetical protein
MKLELAPLLIGLAATLCVSPATATPPAAPLAQNRNDAQPYVAEVQTRAEFPNIRRESRATVRGAFAQSGQGSVELRAEIGIWIDDKKYDWHRVAVEQTTRQNAVSFTINFRGDASWLPANFKGKVVVRITSNVKGTFQNIAKEQMD